VRTLNEFSGLGLGLGLGLAIFVRICRSFVGNFFAFKTSKMSKSNANERIVKYQETRMTRERSISGSDDGQSTKPSKKKSKDSLKGEGTKAKPFQLSSTDDDDVGSPLFMLSQEVEESAESQPMYSKGSSYIISQESGKSSGSGYTILSLEEDDEITAEVPLVRTTDMIEIPKKLILTLYPKQFN